MSAPLGGTPAPPVACGWEPVRPMWTCGPARWLLSLDRHRLHRRCYPGMDTAPACDVCVAHVMGVLDLEAPKLPARCVRCGEVWSERSDLAVVVPL